RTGRDRRGPIGKLAASSMMFAAAAGRAVPVRRALAAQPAALVGGLGGAAVAPPRWWVPQAEAAVDVSPRRDLLTRDLPPRGLPRAVRRVPDEQSWRPGGFASSLVGSDIRVRPTAEVSAAGRLAELARIVPRRAEPPPAQPVGGPRSVSGSE